MARARHRTLRAWFAAAIASAALASAGAGAGASPAAAAAEACPGSGAGPCAYTAVQVVGQRAEGLLRFPEAVAVDTEGDVYVADQLSYVVQKFTAAGTFETQWGSYGGGHGQFGPIGGLAVDAAGDVYVVDSSHNRVQKFGPDGEFITAWGRRGGELGEFDFGSSQNPSQPPGGGIAVSGEHVYVADSGNNRVERFNLEGGEAMAWGSHGSAPGQFSYPRAVAANESGVIVSDDDNHRLEKFSPEGAFEAEAGSQGKGPGQFGFPYGVALDAAGDVYVADDGNDLVVKLTPQLAFAGAWGGVGSKPGQFEFPRALASDPAGDTYVADTANDRIQVFNPAGYYLRTLGASARAPGQLTAPAGLAVDPSGRLLVSDTVDDRIEAFAPGGDTFAEQWTLAGGHAAGFAAPAGIGVDPRGSVYVADPGNQRVVRLWGDGTFLGELGGPADIGGAELAGAGSVAVSPVTDQTYVADTDHNRVLVYGPEGSLQAKWGAGEGDGSPGGGAQGFNRPDAVAIAPSGNVYVADTGNNRVVELSPAGGALAAWGSKGTLDGRFRSPSGVAVDAAGDVYVVDSENDRVEVFEAGGRFLAKWGLRGTAPGELSQPTAIAVDCSGSVYVADTNNNRVQRFTPASPAAGGCLTPGTWPPPLNVAPVLHVSLPRGAGVLARRALALEVSCQRGCRILATAKLSAPGHGGAVNLLAAARGLPPAVAGHLRLLVEPAALRRLRRALGGRRTMRASVRIVAAGPTGLRTTVTRSYIVSR
ncbi:MAG: SMP-30/gluconolactonase/LRE family protein [Solirubrobacteraceae bacterium]